MSATVAERLVDGLAACSRVLVDAVADYRRGEVVVRAGGSTVTLTSAHLRGYWEIEFARRTEPALVSALLDAVDPGTVVYDVGANVGFYTCLLATTAATVHAFEPNPHALADLRRNVSLNGLHNVVIHDCAVSDGPGRAYLSGRGSPSGLGAISTRPTGLIVETVALDDLDATPAPDVVKIDVEGHETAVLRGMRGLLGAESASRRPTVFCEVHRGDPGPTRVLADSGYAVEPLADRFDGNEFVRASAE